MIMMMREYRKESSMTSDSINGLILEYLGTEDRKDSRFNIYIFSLTTENEMESVYLTGENSMTIGSHFI